MSLILPEPQKIIKAGELKPSAKAQVAIGAVYIPNVIDSQGDWMTAEEIQKAAYKFMAMEKLDVVDVMHDNKKVGARIVESYITRKGDPDFEIPGTWAVGIHVPDPVLWGKIESGELGGFSMEVLARRLLNVEPEKKRALKFENGTAIGRTFKHETDDAAHDHSYEAVYKNGKFAGGRTNVHTDKNGIPHFHTILGGVITEEALGHRHRFSTLEHFMDAA